MRLSNETATSEFGTSLPFAALNITAAFGGRADLIKIIAGRPSLTRLGHASLTEHCGGCSRLVRLSAGPFQTLANFKQRSAPAYASLRSQIPAECRLRCEQSSAASPLWRFRGSGHPNNEAGSGNRV
jgi:hypothetical protein